MKKILIFLFFFPLFLYSQTDLSDLVQANKPSVVFITTYDLNSKPLATGSGFFISGNNIVTNYHVIEDCNTAKIKTSDGNYYKVKGVIAADRDWDIAMLEVELPKSKKINPLKLANKYPKEGERIFVIGNPQGIEQNVSDGIISSIQIREGYGKMIYFSAPISPGSSGGPVMNMRGEVIGVASAYNKLAQNLNIDVPYERVELLQPGELISLNDFNSKSGNITNKGSESSPEMAARYNETLLKRAVNQAGWSYGDNVFPEVAEHARKYYNDFDIYKSFLTADDARKLVKEIYGNNKKAKTNEREDGTSIKPIIKSLDYAIEYIEDTLYQEAVRVEIDLISDSKSSMRYLYKDYSYSIYATAERDKVEDIDIALYRDDGSEWKFVEEKNDEVKPYSLITIKPEENGLYQIVVKVKKFKSGFNIARYNLIYFHE